MEIHKGDQWESRLKTCLCILTDTPVKAPNLLLPDWVLPRQGAVMLCVRVDHCNTKGLEGPSAAYHCLARSKITTKEIRTYFWTEVLKYTTLKNMNFTREKTNRLKTQKCSSRVSLINRYANWNYVGSPMASMSAIPGILTGEHNVENWAFKPFPDIFCRIKRTIRRLFRVPQYRFAFDLWPDRPDFDWWWQQKLK